MKKCTQCGKLFPDNEVVVKPTETESEYQDFLNSVLTMPGETYPYPRDTRPIECHELAKEYVKAYGDVRILTKYCGPLRELTPEEKSELATSG